MPKASRYLCKVCESSFVLEFFLEQNKELCCLICNAQCKALAEIKELRAEIALLKDELSDFRKVVEVDKAINEKNKEEDEVRPDYVDDGFRFVKKGRKAKASQQSTESATISLKNRFSVLENETDPEPAVVLIGDSLVRNQDREFCRGRKDRRKHRCLPGRKIEDVTERVPFLVENSKEDTVFVTLVGTNNLQSDTATDIVEKYRAMIREFASRRRKVAVCSIIPRYDVGPDEFRKMSVVNRQVEALCRQEDMHFFNLWHHFCSDRTLYAPDRLHLNGVGRARLGRVLGECLADIPRPLVAGNGSPSIEEVDSVATEVDDANVAGTSHTAPESDVQEAENVDRQEEVEVDLATVPLPDETVQDRDFC